MPQIALCSQYALSRAASEVMSRLTGRWRAVFFVRVTIFAAMFLDKPAEGGYILEL